MVGCDIGETLALYRAQCCSERPLHHLKQIKVVQRESVIKFEGGARFRDW